MDNYERANYGPGEIAALPPTIGLTSRAPTIGSEDRGRPIPMAYNLGDNGNGNGNGNGAPATYNRWLLPLGIGLAIGGVLAFMKTQ